MRLVHYSPVPLGTVLSFAQETVACKPRGLWVSDDNCKDNWPTWCRTENFNKKGLKWAYAVTLARSANILLLTHENDIDTFTRQFQHTTTTNDDEALADLLGQYYPINWQRVAAQYQGLLITPYIWSRRLYNATSWYYAWDCASGCFWDHTAIQTITPINPKLTAIVSPP